MNMVDRAKTGIHTECHWYVTGGFHVRRLDEVVPIQTVFLALSISQHWLIEPAIDGTNQHGNRRVQRPSAAFAARSSITSVFFRIRFSLGIAFTVRLVFVSGRCGKEFLIEFVETISGGFAVVFPLFSVLKYSEGSR